MVTHDFAVAGRFGGHVYNEKRRFCGAGHIEKIIAAPENEYTKELLNDALLICEVRYLTATDITKCCQRRKKIQRSR